MHSTRFANDLNRRESVQTIRFKSKLQTAAVHVARALVAFAAVDLSFTLLIAFTGKFAQRRKWVMRAGVWKIWSS